MLEDANKSAKSVSIPSSSACNAVTAEAVAAVAKEACTASTSACNVASEEDKPD